MKLSYSIRHWPHRDWAQLCASAVDARLSGLEIDSVKNAIFQTRNSPTNPEWRRRPAGSWWART